MKKVYRLKAQGHFRRSTTGNATRHRGAEEVREAEMIQREDTFEIVLFVEEPVCPNSVPDVHAKRLLIFSS